MSSRILRNTTAYLLAGLIPNLVNLIILPLYTSIIPPADYGINALVSMTCSFLGGFGGLQLGTALQRFYVTHEGQRLREYFSTLFFASLLTNLFFFGLLQVIGPWMTENLYGNSSFPFYPYMFLGSFQFLFGSQFAFLNIALRMQERGGRFLVLALLYTTIDFSIGIYLVLVKEYGIEGLLLARAISSAAYTLLLIATLRKLFTFSFEIKELMESLQYSFPSIPHAMANTVFNFADKFLLGLFLDPSSVGLYDLANRFSRVFQRLIQGFDRAYVPDFFRRSEVDKREAGEYLQRVISKWMVYCVLAGNALSLFAEEVIQLMAGPEYYPAYTLIPILVTGCILRGLYYFPANAILFDKRTKLIPVVMVTSGLINILLNIWLIPKFGLPEVAAWTTVGSLGFSFALTGWLSQQQFPFKWPWFSMIFMMSGMVISILVSLLLLADSIWMSLCYKGAVFLGFIVAIWLCNVGGVHQD